LLDAALKKRGGEGTMNNTLERNLMRRFAVGDLILKKDLQKQYEGKGGAK
jgi:hypothetical protein